MHFTAAAVMSPYQGPAVRIVLGKSLSLKHVNSVLETGESKLTGSAAQHEKDLYVTEVIWKGKRILRWENGSGVVK